MSLKLFVFCDEQSSVDVDSVIELLKRLGDVEVDKPELFELEDTAPVLSPGDRDRPTTESYIGLHPTRLLTAEIRGDVGGRADELQDDLEAKLPGAVALLAATNVALAGDAVGVCRVGLVRRNMNLSRDEFFRHWITTHVEIALRGGQHKFSRYINNRVLSAAAPVDGIVEQWFPDASAYRAHDELAGSREDIVHDAGIFSSGFQSFLALKVTADAVDAGQH